MRSQAKRWPKAGAFLPRIPSGGTEAPKLLSSKASRQPRVPATWGLPLILLCRWEPEPRAHLPLRPRPHQESSCLSSTHFNRRGSRGSMRSPPASGCPPHKASPVPTVPLVAPGAILTVSLSHKRIRVLGLSRRPAKALLQLILQRAERRKASVASRDPEADGRAFNRHKQQPPPPTATCRRSAGRPPVWVTPEKHKDSLRPLVLT